MHAEAAQITRKLHDGETPASWLRGDTPYQKAAVIAAMAHHVIKHPDDPEFVRCDLTYRENCIAVVESIMAGNDPDPLPFATQVAVIWKDITSQPPNPSKEIS